MAHKCNSANGLEPQGIWGLKSAKIGGGGGGGGGRGVGAGAGAAYKLSCTTS